jgi:hypothetical protein
MRAILVGAMVAAVAVAAGPAIGGMDDTSGDPPPAHGAVHYSNPSGQVIHEDVHGAGAEFGLAVASSALSVLYHPFRMVYGVVGAALGGFGGWTTGGDMRTAKGIWRPTTEGHYFIRPDYLDGTERFRFNGAVPAVRETEVVEHQVVTTRDDAVIIREAPLRPLDSAPFDDADVEDVN